VSVDAYRALHRFTGGAFTTRRRGRAEEDRPRAAAAAFLEEARGHARIGARLLEAGATPAGWPPFRPMRGRAAGPTTAVAWHGLVGDLP
jgi:hypothetical protein